MLVFITSLTAGQNKIDEIREAAGKLNATDRTITHENIFSYSVNVTASGNMTVGSHIDGDGEFFSFSNATRIDR